MPLLQTDIDHVTGNGRLDERQHAVLPGQNLPHAGALDLKGLGILIEVRGLALDMDPVAGLQESPFDEDIRFPAPGIETDHMADPGLTLFLLVLVDLLDGFRDILLIRADGDGDLRRLVRGDPDQFAGVEISRRPRSRPTHTAPCPAPEP